MDPRTQDVPGYYVWAPPGQTFSVQLDLGVVERLGGEVLRGFGAVPKRGAEVGGLLLGRIDGDVIRVEDFEPIPCAYRRGPSYLLTGEENAVFADACQRWQNRSAGASYAVGYYRSDTREGLSLGQEDLDLMTNYFPAPANCVLLIRPNATKASIAGFFLRDGGAFPQTSPLTFPFRRWELAGEEPPAHRSMMERKRERGGPELVRSPPRSIEGSDTQMTTSGGGALGTPRSYAADAAADFQPAPPQAGAYAGAYAPHPPGQNRMWMPLSFLFLLFGVGLGFMLAMFTLPKNNVSTQSVTDFALGLNVAKSGDNLIVRWNRNASAIRSAQSGELQIDDDKYSPKPQDLDAAHLDNGTLIYRNTSKTVRFKLRVFQNSRVTVEETAEWQEP
jgi:hypothetical protein